MSKLNVFKKMSISFQKNVYEARTRQEWEFPIKKCGWSKHKQTDVH